MHNLIVCTLCSFLLMLVATGSGLTAQRRFFDQPGLVLMASAATIASALTALIVVFGSALGGHSIMPPSANWRPTSSEVLATAGLMIVVFGCARSGKAETGPFALGAWLAGAIVATPSTSYANPAITLAALFASGPIALPADTASLYVVAESGSPTRRFRQPMASPPASR